METNILFMLGFPFLRYCDGAQQWRTSVRCTSSRGCMDRCTHRPANGELTPPHRSCAIIAPVTCAKPSERKQLHYRQFRSAASATSKAAVHATVGAPASFDPTSERTSAPRQGTYRGRSLAVDPCPPRLPESLPSTAVAHNWSNNAARPLSRSGMSQVRLRLFHVCPYCHKNGLAASSARPPPCDKSTPPLQHMQPDRRKARDSGPHVTAGGTAICPSAQLPKPSPVRSFLVQ